MAASRDDDRLDPTGVLGPLEAEAMEVLWAAGVPMPVRSVLEVLNEGRRPELAYTTVMTVLSRLADKGVLTRERHGRGFCYEPAVDDHAAIAVRAVMRDFGEAAVAGFVDEVRADPALLARLRTLLDSDGAG